MTGSSQQNIQEGTEIMRILKYHKVVHAKRIIYTKKLQIRLCMKIENIIKYTIPQYQMM